MVHKGKLFIDDVEVDCKTLSFQDGVKQIGRWDAQVNVTSNNRDFLFSLVGYETVKIYRGGTQVFQGYLLDKPQKYDMGVTSMPLGGPEWTGKLNNYITDQETISDALSVVLEHILVNTPFIVGEVEATASGEADPTVYDTSLEFLSFELVSNMCIAYDTDVELSGYPAVGTFVVPPSNRRCSFFSHATGYFYVVAYDSANSLLKYNSTVDYVAWKGWTSLGFNAGASGNYGICWDEANGRLFLLADDGANIDFYRYSEAGGTLTQEDADGNVDAGDLLCGPVLDSEGDVFWVCDDGANYVIWEFDYSGSTWTAQDSWAIADNDDPKYMFKGDDAGDVIVIVFDDDNNDLEEWTYDAGTTEITFTRKIGDVATVGYVCGFQDSFKNMYLVWEDTDLDFTYRYIDDTSWATIAEIVDTADYQTMDNFSLFGDEASNLYLFYVNDDGVTRTLDIKRRFEGTWGSTVEVSVDADASSKPRAPENGLACFATWLNTGDDPVLALMAPHGWCTGREFGDPADTHDFETGLDFDSTYVEDECSIDASNAWATSGSWSCKTYTPGLEDEQKNCFGVYNNGGAGFGYTAVSYRCYLRVTQSGITDNGDNDIFFMLRNSDGFNDLYLGWERDAGELTWYVELREAGVLTEYRAGAPAINNDYLVEFIWVQDGAAGTLQVWIDGVLTFDIGPVDTDNGGDISELWLGQSANNVDGPSIVYMDDIAFTGFAHRFGGTEAGYFRTATYNVSGSFSYWGHLDSTNDNNAETSWSILDNANVVLLDGLKTPVDLDAAGLLATETAIKIRADLTDSKSTGRNYIFDVRISEVRGFVDLDTDYEKVGKAIDKLAKILGLEYKLNWDNTVDALYELGEDKSDRIILLTASSQSHFPDIKPNIKVVVEEPDFGNHANCIKLLGATDNQGIRAEATASDAASVATYGEIWDSVKNPDCITIGMCQIAAQTQVNQRKDPSLSISNRFNDDYDPSQIQRGDTIRDIADEIILDVTARIVFLTYAWSESGESVSAELINPVKTRRFNSHLLKTEDLLRWIT